MSDHLPLFPLPLVLFPGAALALRIFETRYLNMVRECGRGGTGFGVVLHEPPAPERSAGFAPVGTEAIIEDFSTLEDGLLGLNCRGRRRFRVRECTTRDDGLLIGRIEWMGPEDNHPVPPECAVLQTMLREILQHQEFNGIVDVDPDDASSLGMALSALLPLHADQAQICLELTDPVARLEHLVSVIERVSAHD